MCIDDNEAHTLVSFEPSQVFSWQCGPTSDPSLQTRWKQILVTTCMNLSILHRGKSAVLTIYKVVYGCHLHPLVSSLVPAIFLLKFAGKAISLHWNIAFMCFTARSFHFFISRILWTAWMPWNFGNLYSFQPDWNAWVIW